ncbi:NAD(P)/FAD-dependent oxidoreductase [Vibrio hannami]|uniref:NAD(P)/FAD-dependent oxidoreductase n=1 Tax=Vibrio hannami TaxID=2717094 RepID=UPI00240F3048|nr:NAD(P)/FAD-dependent oxidoreductase [Vibrio hannami]MDG3085555.1 NAD(P)/FAD-dependent oxidoreductase [Vibrio hannami]
MKMFEPMNIGSLQLKNRIIMAPMLTNFMQEDGSVTDRYIEYILARVKGDVGLVITEGAHIMQAGRGFTRGLGIDSDMLIESHKRLTEAVHQHGGRIALQLHHSGRQTSSQITGQAIVSASAIPCPIFKEVPKVLDTDEIRVIVTAYAQAALRAEQAGYDAVEIHGAHGYLVNQFLSEYSNKRQDQYGGSINNRTRFLKEILAEIRAVGCTLPLSLRLPSDEFVEGGIKLEQAIEIARLAVEYGIDCLHVTGGVYQSAHRIIQPSIVGQGLYRDNARAIKEAINSAVPVIVVGRIKKPAMIEEILDKGNADGIALGRTLLADPEFILKIRNRQFDLIRPCIACNQGCVDNINSGQSISCIGNLKVGKEIEFDEQAEPVQGLNIVVVGAGPAGLEAARTLAENGNVVKVVEQRGYLGGQMELASRPPHKGEIAEFLSFLVNACKKSDVEFVLNQSVDKLYLQQELPDAVVIASGTSNFIPEIEGLKDYITADDILMQEKSVSGSTVIIGGGLVGCETAEYIRQRDSASEVHIIEMQDDIAVDMSPSAKAILSNSLIDLDVNIWLKTTVVKVSDGKLHVQNQDGTHILQADTVVFATGYRSQNSLNNICNDLGIPYASVGDCNKPRNILSAVHEGHNFVKSAQLLQTSN